MKLSMRFIHCFALSMPLAASGCDVYRMSPFASPLYENQKLPLEDVVFSIECDIRHTMSAYSLAESLCAMDKTGLLAVSMGTPSHVKPCIPMQNLSQDEASHASVYWFNDEWNESHNYVERYEIVRECSREFGQTPECEWGTNHYLDRPCGPFEYSAILRNPDGSTMRIELETSECDEFEESASEVCVNITGIYR